MGTSFLYLENQWRPHPPPAPAYPESVDLFLFCKEGEAYGKPRIAICGPDRG